MSSWRSLHSSHKTSRWGFTLTEMMIVILLVGIMATVSAPPLFRFIQSNRLQTDTDRMAADLQYARSLSVARGDILRFQATPAGYTLIDPITNNVIRQHNFEHGLALDANVTVNFFPWGMADAAVLNISNHTGANQVSVMPTGIVEVN